MQHNNPSYTHEARPNHINQTKTITLSIIPQQNQIRPQLQHQSTQWTQRHRPEDAVILTTQEQKNVPILNLIPQSQRNIQWQNNWQTGESSQVLTTEIGKKLPC